MEAVQERMTLSEWGRLFGSRRSERKTVACRRNAQKARAARMDRRSIVVAAAAEEQNRRMDGAAD